MKKKKKKKKKKKERKKERKKRVKLASNVTDELKTCDDTKKNSKIVRVNY